MVIDHPVSLTPKTVLVLGQSDRHEFQPLLRWLTESIGRTCRFMIQTDVAAARTVFDHDQFPDLIVVLQSWPEEFSRADVHDLFAFAPLARIVVCCGAWCESDGRNHSIWPLSVRIPLWGAVSRIRREWQLIESSGEVDPLPWSASREEIFAADHPPFLNASEPQRILIDSPDPWYVQYLIERLRDGNQIVDTDQPSMVLFDVDPWGAVRTAALTELRTRHPQAEFIALANLIQPPLIADLNRFGISKVVPKLSTPWDAEVTSQ
ncbi:hypothetical protein [Schlesneria sp. T3-172]|uniref:hypothetical protein n=2 Tax=Schlesneria TaxID=656899 RepID=UPI0037C5B311